MASNHWICCFLQNLGPLLEGEQLQRWEDLELAQSLLKMPDVVYCPRCSQACLEDAQNCAQCAQCFFVFCSLCNESWHPGIEVRAACGWGLTPNNVLMACVKHLHA